MDDLFEDSGFTRGGRPLVMAASLVAIAALGAAGLYQGFHLTWRDYGPAPSYPQVAAAPAPATPPVVQAASPDTDDDAPAAKVEVAANDADPAPQPTQPATPPAATDAAALLPADPPQVQPASGPATPPPADSPDTQGQPPA